MHVLKFLSTLTLQQLYINNLCSKTPRKSTSSTGHKKGTTNRIHFVSKTPVFCISFGLGVTWDISAGGPAQIQICSCSSSVLLPGRSKSACPSLDPVGSFRYRYITQFCLRLRFRNSWYKHRSCLEHPIPTWIIRALSWLRFLSGDHRQNWRLQFLNKCIKQTPAFFKLMLLKEKEPENLFLVKDLNVKVLCSHRGKLIFEP